MVDVLSRNDEVYHRFANFLVCIAGLAEHSWTVGEGVVQPIESIEVLVQIHWEQSKRMKRTLKLCSHEFIRMSRGYSMLLICLSTRHSRFISQNPYHYSIPRGYLTISCFSFSRSFLHFTAFLNYATIRRTVRGARSPWIHLYWGRIRQKQYSILFFHFFYESKGVDPVSITIKQRVDGLETGRIVAAAITFDWGESIPLFVVLIDG